MADPVWPESVRALRVLSGPRRASSRPVLVETEAGVLFTKLRGAAQGTAPLVAEIVVASLAEALDLRVPRRTLLVLEADTPTDDHDQELGDLLRASVGRNLAFELLKGARDLEASEAEAVDAPFAVPVLWLDALVINRDRMLRNRT